jgi:hypothetical protein
MDPPNFFGNRLLSDRPKKQAAIGPDLITTLYMTVRDTMSKEAPAWYVNQYMHGAFAAYQSKGFTLGKTVQAPVKVDGDQLHFFKYGEVTAERNVQRGDKAKPMNGGREKIILTTEKMRAFDEVYEDDLDQMSIDEQQVVYQQGAMALGRASDSQIVTEVRETTKEIGDYSAAMGLDALLRASQQLQSEDVPFEPGKIFCAVDSVSWNRLLTYKEFTSQDYVGPQLPLLDGGLAKTWNNIHVMQISDKTLRELDAANQATCLMWSQDSVGFGWSRKLTGTVAWDNRADCWTHNMRLRTGPKLLQPKGALKIKVKYDPADIVLA